MQALEELHSMQWEIQLMQAYENYPKKKIL